MRFSGLVSQAARKRDVTRSCGTNTRPRLTLKYRALVLVRDILCLREDIICFWGDQRLSHPLTRLSIMISASTSLRLWLPSKSNSANSLSIWDGIFQYFCSSMFQSSPSSVHSVEKKEKVDKTIRPSEARRRFFAATSRVNFGAVYPSTLVSMMYC